MINKSQTSSTQDMESHHNYLQKVGVMKSSSQFKQDFFDTDKIEFRTDEFLYLSIHPSFFKKKS